MKVITAYFILSEISIAQYIGGTVILVGVIISHIGNQRKQLPDVEIQKVNST